MGKEPKEIKIKFTESKTAFRNINGINITDEEQREKIYKRVEFVHKYCRGNGWDFLNLTTEQIMKIRDQDEWKNPINES